MRSKASDAQADRPVPRHARGGTGRGRQHAGGLSPRPRRISPTFSAAAGRISPTSQTETLRDYLADLDTRGFKSSSVARRLSAMRHLFRFLLNERIRSDDPAAILSGPEARPRPAEGAVDRRRRPHADARQGTDRRRQTPRPRSGCARCGSIACSKCSTPRACASPSWCRCRARRRGRDARMIVVRGKGNKERLVPLNEASRQAMADYLAAMEAAKAEQGQATPPPRNGCFPPSAKAAI